MTPGPDAGGTRDRAAEVRRAALASKVLLNVFGTGSGPVTAGQLARWQADAGWLGRALGEVTRRRGSSPPSKPTWSGGCTCARCSPTPCSRRS